MGKDDIGGSIRVSLPGNTNGRSRQGQQQQQAAQQREKILRALNSTHWRMLVVFVVFGGIMALIADAIYPSLTADAYKQTANALAEEAKKGIPSRAVILHHLQQNHLAWYYVTSDEGQPNRKTEPYNPQLPAPVLNISRNVEWKGDRYWETVVRLDDGNYLHVGFFNGPVVLSGLLNGPMVAQWPFAVVFIMNSGLLLLSIALLYLCVSQPLGRLSKSVSEILPAKVANDTHEVFDFFIAPTEVQELSKVLSKVHTHFETGGALPESFLLDHSMPVPETFGRTVASREFDSPSDSPTDSQNRISEAYSKEADDDFVTKLCRELEMIPSRHQVCQRILDRLNDKFPTSIIYGAFFLADKTGKNFAVEAFLGLDDRSVQTLKRLDHARVVAETFGGGTALVLMPDAMREFGLHLMTSGTNIKTAIYLPLSSNGRRLGMLGIYFSSEGQMVQERFRVLRSLADASARCLLKAVSIEEEEEAARSDALTGLRNKKFFGELMPAVFNRAAVDPEKNPVSFVMVDCDNFSKLNEVYGQVVGDQMLQELAKTLRQCVRADDYDGKLGPGDYLIRFGGEEFLIVMENTDSKRAVDVAERIRAAVESKLDWPGDVGRWTVSAGVSSYPADGKVIEELVSKAEMALFYVKEELGRNKVVHIKHVPKGFASEKHSAAIAGELGVFDGAALLQSLATAQKTGLLTVSSPDGKQLWMVFQSGKPAQARLGKFYGAAAIVEFVTTFKEGAFNFQDMNAGSTATKLPKLDDMLNVTKGLERCLMDGALAQDNYNSARAVIPNTDIVLRPVHAMEFSSRWGALSQLKDPPTSDELNIMSDIVQRADGETTLVSIVKAMDNVPTGLLWRSAALLIQHGLVQTKPAVPV
jgi:diguanylate cyclase (GGDEF)-like protein